MLAAFPVTRGLAFSALILAVLIISTQRAEATNRKTLAASPSRTLPPSTVARSKAAVTIATATAPGQAGYVHFFLMKDSEGSVETQVGIELEDQRIAWSFPGAGVGMTSFIKSGVVETSGKTYEIQHLYGIRPFPDERAMRALREQLDGRIAPYIDDETPYCYTRARGDPLCLSCLDFVVRVLFPGHFPDFPALPRDFQRTAATPGHTTDDLLLYLLGLQGLQTLGARVKRVERLALPDNLREDVLRLVEAMDAEETADSGRGKAVTREPRRNIQPGGTSAQPRAVRRKKS